MSGQVGGQASPLELVGGCAVCVWGGGVCRYVWVCVGV